MVSKQGSLPAPGMEPPRNKKIEASIEALLETRSDARRQSNKAKAKHDALMQLMADEGFELYPFIDPDTKKKCVVKADKTPHAKVFRGARAKRELNGDEQKPATKGKRAKSSDDDQVESRRVSRTDEHDKMA